MYRPIYPEEDNEDEDNFFDENLEVTTSKEVEDEEIVNKAFICAVNYYLYSLDITLSLMYYSGGRRRIRRRR